mmetsp:Transcript_44142/g.76945  ORF Transcript_44142/g.76945 Transcript_44142/m.76945 type:complete len:208 (+) Transcript_44142:1407-2030(+)
MLHIRKQHARSSVCQSHAGTIAALKGIRASPATAVHKHRIQGLHDSLHALLHDGVLVVRLHEHALQHVVFPLQRRQLLLHASFKVLSGETLLVQFLNDTSRLCSNIFRQMLTILVIVDIVRVRVMRLRIVPRIHSVFIVVVRHVLCEVDVWNQVEVRRRVRNAGRKSWIVANHGIIHVVVAVYTADHVGIVGVHRQLHCKRIATGRS